MTQEPDHLILPISHPKIGAGGKTGAWRVFRPIIDENKCIKCLLCWIHCPENAIIVKQRDQIPQIDYVYCKGCFVCADVCPKDAIKKVREGI